MMMNHQSKMQGLGVHSFLEHLTVPLTVSCQENLFHSFDLQPRPNLFWRVSRAENSKSLIIHSLCISSN